MQAMIDELAKQAAESLGQVSSKETLASFWQEYLSKNGKIPALMKNLRSVAPEERPAMGKIINELKQKVQADYDAAAAKVKLEGGQNDLIDRIVADPLFPLTREEIEAQMDPALYVGRAPEQVTEFLEGPVAELLARYPDEDIHAELSV